MKAKRKESSSQQERFLHYLNQLARAAGHADRVMPLQNYTKGLLLPIERKSVEPMAARLAPENVRQMHQSLHHIVAEAAWSDVALLREIRHQVLPRLIRKHGLAGWIVYDTGFPKKGRHSVGVTGSIADSWASRKTAELQSVYRWPPNTPVCRSPMVYIFPRSGRKTGSAERRPGCPKRFSFKPKPRWRWDRFEGWSKRMCHGRRCWRTPPMAMTTFSFGTGKVQVAVCGGGAVFDHSLADGHGSAAGRGSERDGASNQVAAARRTASTTFGQGTGFVFECNGLAPGKLARRNKRHRAFSFRCLTRARGASGLLA